jgi:hypothetical protein
MSVVVVSRRLAALVAYGCDANVALLGRLGAGCALYADSKLYRERTNDRSLKLLGGLSAPQAFGFYCDWLETTDKVYPLANFASLVATHLARVVPGAVPRDTYLLAAAIETGVPGIADDVLTFWSDQPDRSAAKQTEMGGLMSRSELRTVYNMAPHTADAIDSTVAAFLLGRAAHQRHLCVAMTTHACFTRNITVADLDATMLAIHANTKQIATEARYLPLELPQNVVDPMSKSTAPVRMMIADEARLLIEQVANRQAPVVAEWFTALAQEQATVDDIRAATLGDIAIGARHKRLRHLMPAPQSAAAGDADEDRDDKK